MVKKFYLIFNYINSIIRSNTQIYKFLKVYNILKNKLIEIVTLLTIVK